MMPRRGRLWLAGALAFGLFTTACGGDFGPPSSSAEGGCAEPSKKGRMSISTGNTTGVYYILGGGIAQVISDNVKGMKATAESTGASVENIQLVCAGESGIAMSLGDTAAAAVEGSGPFKGDQKPVKALARLYVDATHVMVRADAGIDSIADLSGKRVSTGSPNSGTEVIAERLLKANDLDPEEDIDRQRIPTEESVPAMKDGALDAIVHVGGLPHPGMLDLTTSMKKGVEMLDLGEDLVKLNEEYNDVYVSQTVPAGTYEMANKDTDQESIGVPTLLLVSDAMPKDQAYELTKTIFEHLDQLEKVHPAAKNINPEDALKTGNVKLHPGAQKYFEETSG